jgi:hypothetical protein
MPHCRPLKIVATHYCAVWQCPDCELIQLQLGDLTLRLTPQQMHGLARGLHQAVLKLNPPHAGQPVVPDQTFRRN